MIYSSSDGDEIYAEFEIVYYKVRYVNIKAKFKFENWDNNDCDEHIYIYIYI